MCSIDGRYVLTFNGEIYNYKILRLQLAQLGHSFVTESDTEVLLHWLIAFGTSGLSELNGMFAFALLDREKSSLILARDRHGMKPLYYSDTSAAFILSSEIKGILATNLLTKTLNTNQIQHYLEFKHANSPETFYKDIQSVKPGHFIRIENNEWSEISFLPPLEDSIEFDKSKVVDQVETILKSALSRHLVADTDVGLFLSGGVDSTLLLALAKESTESTLPTFSISNKESEGSFGTNDAKYARKASSLYGSDHHEFTADKTLLNGIQEHLLQMDQPIGDSASLLTSYLSKQAGHQVKCVLSGAGADEWFAGYNRHEAYFHYLSNALLSGNTKILRGMTKVLPTGVNHPLRKSFQLAKKFLENLDPDPKTTYLNFLGFKYFRQSLKKETDEDQDLFSWALKYDREHYLTQDVLTLNDHWSMNNSIEMRMPYLDNELTNYLSALPQECLIERGKKWILKSILVKYGGDEFAQRPKEGFGLPTGKWLHDGHFQEQLQFLKNPKSVIFNYVDQKLIEGLIQSHLRKKRDYSLEIWSVMILANWLEIHFT